MIRARRRGELRQLAELHRHPGRHDADGPRARCPTRTRCTSACPACTARSPRSTALQKADLLVALGARFDDRVTGQLSTLRARRQDHPRRHRPGRDRQEPHRRRADRRRRSRRSSPTWSSTLLTDEDAGRRRRQRVAGRPARGVAGDVPARLRRPPDGRLAPQYVIERIGQLAGPEAHLRRRRRPAPDVGRAVHPVRAPERLAQLRRPRARWATRCRRPWGPRWASPTATCGRSTATAASR